MDKPLTDLQSFLLAAPYLQPIGEKAILMLSKRFGIPKTILRILIKAYSKERAKNG